MFNIKKLSNGLRLITAPIQGAKSATVLFIVGTGSKYESRRQNGISHFLEHLFFKGTAKRPTTLAISSELDKVGGEYNAFTGKEYTGFWVKVEASQLDLALDVLADMMLNSKFEAEEIEREKGVIIEELNMYLDNPLIYIEDLYEQCLYGDSPAGWDTIGTKNNILRFRRPDFINYLRTQYGATNAIICLAGKLSFGDINKYFAKLPKSQIKDKIAVRERQSRPKLKLHHKKTDQAHLSLGVRAMPFGHQDEMVLKIIGAILGGSMSSRLFTNLRERHGLAYYVRTNYETYTDSGYVTTRAGVPIDKVNQAIGIILAEYKKITLEKVRTGELEKVKQLLMGRTALQLESSDDIASWYARQAMLFHEQKRPAKILTPDDYYRAVRRVEIKDIVRVAKKIFVNSKLNLAVIGPYKDEKAFEKILRI